MAIDTGAGPASGQSSTPLTAEGAALTRGTERRRPAKIAPWMEDPSPIARAAKVIFLVLTAFVMLFPFVYVIAVSFSSYKDVLGGGLILFPKNPTLTAYNAILSGNIVSRALTVSALLTIFGTLAKVIATVMLAYGLSKPGVPGAKIVLFLVLGSFLFSPGLIPNYLLVKQLGLLNTYQSLVLPGLIGGFNLIIMRSFFQNIPQELLDSARIDGASDVRILWNIILPLSKAVLAVVALFYGVGIWNSFFNAILYLNDSSMWPIQVVLRQYVLQGSALANAAEIDPNQPPPPPQTIQMAVVVVATLPILLVYPFLQKYFTKGVLTGAIKG
jgi:ABC-type glycerol-3-phosphate transport system permease component